MLSAQDVHDKQFKLVRQSTGYDIDEVDGFLDEVEAALSGIAAERDAAVAAAQRAEERVAELSARLGTSGEESQEAVAPEPQAGISTSAEGAARILELAQRTADEYASEARRAADGLVAEARDQAHGLLSQAESQRTALEARVSALRTFESEVRTRLTTYFEGQLHDLRTALSGSDDAEPTEEPVGEPEPES